MKFSILITSVLIFVSGLVHSQEAYYEGSIRMKDGEKQSLLVSNAVTCDGVTVKNERNKKTSTYSPEYVSEVVFGSAKYVSRFVVRKKFYEEQSAVEKVYLTNGDPRIKSVFNTAVPNQLFLDPSKSPDSSHYFLEVLVEGPLSMFKLKGEDENARYYLEKESEVFVEVPPVYVRLDTTEDSKRQLERPIYSRSIVDFVLTPVYDYLSVFNAVLYSEDMKFEGPVFNYNEAEMIALVKEYNRRQGVPSGGKTYSRPKENFHIGVYGGMAFLTSRPFSNMFGVNALKVMGSESKLTYLRISAEMVNSNFNIPPADFLDNPTINATIYNGLLEIQKPFRRGAFKPYLSAGFGLTFLEKIHINNVEFAFSLGLGGRMSFKKFSVAADFKLFPLLKSMSKYALQPFTLSLYF